MEEKTGHEVAAEAHGKKKAADEVVLGVRGSLGVVC